MFSETIFYTDPAVFKVFSYTLIRGNPETVLTQPNSIVITTDIAVKYFANEDPIGKVLRYDDDKSFLVTGLMENVPDNSYYSFNILGSFSTLNEATFPALSDWRSHWLHTYFLLKEGVSPAALQQRFPDFINTYIENQYRDRYRPQLQAMNDIHLHSDLSGEWGDTIEIMYIYIFLSIAIFVLLIASINFVNLSTAQSSARAKEVGVRKTLGAYKSQLVKQFLAETVVLSFFALIFALVLVEIAVPWMSSISPRNYEVTYLNNSFYLLSIIGITLLVGIIAGSYPAFLLSSIKPVSVISGANPTGMKRSRMRKILVVSQFGVAAFMIIVNLVLSQQIGFLKGKDLGFQQENVLLYRAPLENTVSKQMAIRNDLIQMPEVVDVTFASAEPGDGYSNGRFLPEGTLETDGMMLPNLSIDENYLRVLEIDLLEGRNFSSLIASDTSEAVILNETAVQQFGWNDPVGKKLEWLNAVGGPTEMTVIGVVKDFHFENLHEPIRPLIIHYTPQWFFNYLVKVESDDINSTAETIGKKWAEYDPTRPASFYILEEDLGLEYNFEGVINSLLNKFTIVTIFIACLGLLGLASFTSAQRTREIGIRKVLGANTSGIMFILSKEFLKYVICGNIFAIPVAIYLMNLWLQQFAYRVEIGFTIILASALLTLLLSTLTVSYQAFRAARANPVDSLKHV